MRRIYDPLPGQEFIPYLKLITDYEPSNEPLKRPQTEICVRVRDNIFYAGYDRLPTMYSLPDNEDDFHIPEPRFV